MKINRNYIPKERKFNVKIVVFFMLIILVLSTFAVKYYYDQQNIVDDGFKICGLSSDETAKRLKTRQQEAYESALFLEVRDYTYFGETLKFYNEPYVYGLTDDFIGNTVFLNNLCGLSVDDKSSYLLSYENDIGIQIDTLQDGFYEIEILKDFNFNFLKTSENIDIEIASIKRDNQIKTARIFSNRDLINGNFDEPLLKRNVLYLEVKTIENNEAYDIVLDPSALNHNDFGGSNYGHFYMDMYESDETYEMATLIRDELEKYGLRVYLTRDNISPVDTFGDKGRISSAYETGAKYYVHLRLESSGSSMDRGLTILYSNFTSNRFATNVAKAILDGTSLQASPYEDGFNIPGVYQTSLESGYDYNDIVRETGGMMTGAGVNGIFADLQKQHTNSKMGMYAIDILYGYMTDPDDYNVWINEKELLAQKTAEGILIQLGIATGGE